MTLADLLFAPEREPDAGAPLVHGPGDAGASWDDVRRQAMAVAGALREAGVQAGEAVGVMLPNGVDLIATLFGVWRAGGVYVPLNPRAAAHEVTHALDATGPVAAVTSPALEGHRREPLGSRPTFLVDAGHIAVVAPPTDQLPAGGDRRVYDPDVALIQFTSGTTGRPKPVLLTHSGVLTLLDNVIGKLRGGSAGAGSGARAAHGPEAGEAKTEPGDGSPEDSARSSAAPGGRRAPMPNLIPVSLSLWAGIYNVLFALRVGAPVVVMDGFDPPELVRLVQRHGIRSTVLPPAAMVALVDDPRVTDLAPLRFVRSITAPLSPLQARRFKDRFGIAVLNSYGQTEIGGEIVGWNAADSRAHGDTKLGSVGRPHAGVHLRIVAATATDVGVPEAGALVDVPAGEAGELWVRTPAMSAGYADGRSLGDRLTPDGWFRTGDIARIDVDGFVWIEGRLSDMINRGGLKVYPAEVEEVLRTSPAVADAAVVAVPDPRLGEVPYAFVVAVPGASTSDDAPAETAAAATDPRPDTANLERLCRDHLAPYKVPVAFELVDALPRNDVGKVLKADLAARAATSLGTSASP